MLHPAKTEVLRGNGLTATTKIPYHELLDGVWFLQIVSIHVASLNHPLPAAATVVTPFVKTTETTELGNHRTEDTVLWALPLKSDADGDFFVFLPIARFRITNPTAEFKVSLRTDAVSAKTQESCKTTVCCHFFKES